MTRYEAFGSIDIESTEDIPSVVRETKTLTHRAANYDQTSVLDVGTGHGFVPIYLATQGFDCEGVDINPTAIEYARKNASRNDVDVGFYVSDLFSEVTGQYGLITFHPPVGHVGSSFFMPYIEMLKSYFPRDNRFLSAIAFKLLQSKRRGIVDSFLSECENHITPEGTILLVVHESDLERLKKAEFSVTDTIDEMRVIAIDSLP